MNYPNLKNKFRNLSLLFGSFLISLLVAEGVSRLVYPIKLNPVFIYADGEITGKQLWRVPGKIYRQVADEFDVVTTITSKGYRVPDIEKGQPEIVFCGDSFTFGTGLADEDTFVYQFFKATGVSCANLGYPGAGTRRELDLLEKYFLEEKWRPRQVWLFMLVMTDGFFFAGNDLADNLMEDLQEQKTAKGAMNRTTVGEVVSREVSQIGFLREIRDLVVEKSNLARIIQFTLAPQIKAWISRGPQDNQDLYEKALGLTQKQLFRLKHLSEQYGFEYKIFVLHPLQDIVRGSSNRTLAAINQISPSPVIETVSLFRHKPESCYYRYDQHFNREGARRVAQFLIDHYHRQSNNNNENKIE